MAMNANAISVAANKVAKTGGSGPSKEEQRAKTIKDPTQNIRAFANANFKKFQQACGKSMDHERFMRILITVISRDEKLIRSVLECPESLLGACLTAAQLGLEPNTPLGQGYLIPYFEKNKITGQFEMRISFQLGYQGVVELAYRSGLIEYIDTEVVYEKDMFKYQLGTNPFINHVPCCDVNPGKVTHYYAVIKIKNGGYLFKVWTVNKVMDHAMKFSKSYNEKSKRFFGPWDDNFDAMAKKTVLLDCLKLAPKSATLSAQLAADNTTKSVTVDSENINVLEMRNEEYALNGERHETAALPPPEEPAKPEPEKVPVAVGASPLKSQEEDLGDVS